MNRCVSSRLGALLTAAALISGCASANPLDRLLGDHVSGDAAQARVSGLDSRTEALPLAIAHCARFRRSAQFDRSEGGDFVFTCVQRD